MTKTVIVHADGTVEDVPALPHTGGDATTLWLAICGAVAVAAGVGIFTATRK